MLNHPLFLRKKLTSFFEEIIFSRKNQKHIVIGNKIPNKESIIVSGNDYICLANNPKILKAQIDSLKFAKEEPIMSAVFLRGANNKKRFEKKFANFVGFEDSVLCQSGWDANIGLIQSIAEKNIPIYIDFNAHASLWEGIKSAQANPKPFLHNNLKHLEKLIKRNGEGVIIIDSIYSVKGDIAPLQEITDITHNYNCILVVDESHSLGTHGKDGCGLVKELKLNNKIHFLTVSLAKTFASRAGIVACSKEFGEYFPFVSQPAIFSSTLLPHEIAGFEATLEVIKKSNDKRKKLFAKASYLKNNLIKIGYKIDSQSQIISLETGDDKTTEIVRDYLETNNIFGAVFCYPATPKNKSVVRLSINSRISKKQLDHIIYTCKKIKEKGIL